MHGFWTFARAPLAWSFAILALHAPFAFVEPVIYPPPARCIDYLDCGYRYVGLVFDPTPHPANLAVLLIVPSTFLAFLAARVAGIRDSPRAHWFMAGPVFAIIGALALFYVFPIQHLFIRTSVSFVPALIAVTQQVGLHFGALAGVPIALLTLIGAAIWRALRPAQTALT